MASYKANYLHRGKWWVAWTDDVPGAVTQGRTLASARENLKDAIALMLQPADVDELPGCAFSDRVDRQLAKESNGREVCRLILS